jgi:proline iminopeptidase
MKKLKFLLLAFVLAGVSGVCYAQSPREGYLRTPDGVQLFYKIAGSGPETLVVVHGGPGNSLESIFNDFEPISKNRTVIYYDQRGQGKSELVKDGSKLGYEQHVADLEAVRQHFKLDKMTLMGNSWGGLLISLYAVEHPDRVERMILDSPAGPMKGFLDDMEDEISRRSAKIYTPQQIANSRKFRDPNTWLKAKDPIAICRDFYYMVLRTYTYSQTFGDGYKGDLCVGGPDSVRQQPMIRAHVWSSLGDFNLMPKLGVVKAPVLVIHGAADVIPLRSSEFWATGYPNARLLVIQKAGHISQVEAPDIFFPAIETFLKGAFPKEAVSPRPAP